MDESVHPFIHLSIHSPVHPFSVCLSIHSSIHATLFLLETCIGLWQGQCINLSCMVGDVQKSASFGVLGLPEISSYNHHERGLDLFTQHLAPSVDLSI